VDAPILIALISTAGVLITGLASVLVAVITNRRESRNAASDAAERSADEAARAQLAAKDERIQLRDEQLSMAKTQLGECLQKSASVQGELQEVVEELAATRAERDEARANLAVAEEKLRNIAQEDK
jgi:chromosome segregation ATPase